MLIDSYSESNQDASSNIYSAQPNVGQSFTASLAGKLSSCKAYLRKSGSPTGNIVAKLYAHTGTYGTSSLPTGDPLATSDNVDVSTLSTSFELVTFTFSGAEQYDLVNGTYYCIQLQYSGGDADNCAQWGQDGSSPSHSGNLNNGTNPYPAYDFCFYVYGDVEAEGIAIAGWKNLLGVGQG